PTWTACGPAITRRATSCAATARRCSPPTRARRRCRTSPVRSIPWTSWQATSCPDGSLREISPVQSPTFRSGITKPGPGPAKGPVRPRQNALETRSRDDQGGYAPQEAIIEALQDLGLLATVVDQK